MHAAKGRETDFQRFLDEMDIITKQNGHSKGPFSASAGRAGIFRLSGFAADVAQDVCDLPVSDASSTPSCKEIDSFKLSFFGNEEATVLCI
jgi:hypothetical protein